MVAPKLGGSKWRGWFVRYRVEYRHHINVLQLLCEVDISYADSPESLHVKQSRIIWRHERVEAWAKLSSEQHGIQFISRLLREQKVTDHNIESHVNTNYIDIDSYKYMYKYMYK